MMRNPFRYFNSLPEVIDASLFTFVVPTNNAPGFDHLHLIETRWRSPNT